MMSVAILLVADAALLAAGCGGSGDNSGDGSRSEAATGSGVRLLGPTCPAPAGFSQSPSSARLGQRDSRRGSGRSASGRRRQRPPAR